MNNLKNENNDKKKSMMKQKLSTQVILVSKKMKSIFGKFFGIFSI